MLRGYSIRRRPLIWTPDEENWPAAVDPAMSDAEFVKVGRVVTFTLSCHIVAGHGGTLGFNDVEVLSLIPPAFECKQDREWGFNVGSGTIWNAQSSYGARLLFYNHPSDNRQRVWIESPDGSSPDLSDPETTGDIWVAGSYLTA